MSDARTRSAARALFNIEHGHDPNSCEEWDEAPMKVHQNFEARAAVLVGVIDAADDRIRLTMPEFNNIKAQAVGDLSIDLHSRFGGGSLSPEISSFLQEQRSVYGDRYIEPVNHEAAMASLIRERTAAALRSTADGFDAASLSDITADMEIDPAVPPRFKRIMIRGCADWLRTRAEELDAGTRTPYIRVDTRAVINMDRHSALLNALHKVIERAKVLTVADLRSPSFIMTDHLVAAIESVGEE